LALIRMLSFFTIPPLYSTDMNVKDCPLPVSNLQTGITIDSYSYRTRDRNTGYRYTTDIICQLKSQHNSVRHLFRFYVLT
jgi:hypothetical protein